MKIAYSYKILTSVAAVGTCGLLTVPMTRSILSRMTPAHQQGNLLSLLLFYSLISLIILHEVTLFYHVQIWEPLCAWDISMLFP